MAWHALLQKLSLILHLEGTRGRKFSDIFQFWNVLCFRDGMVTLSHKNTENNMYENYFLCQAASAAADESSGPAATAGQTADAQRYALVQQVSANVTCICGGTHFQPKKN